MSARDELEKFVTPASRALVDQFMAEPLAEDNDVDMDEVVRQNLADHEAALTGKPAGPESDWAPMWSRIDQVATEQPDVRPDMKPGQFERILKQEKRPSTTDLALIADVFGVTVPWLVTGADEDADVLVLLGREAKHARQEIAAADPQAGLANLKRRLKNPKPTVGYIVVCPDWDPRDRQDGIDLWNQRPTVKAAQASVEYSNLVGSSRTVIVRVDTTFTIVDGGGCDG